MPYVRGAAKATELSWDAFPEPTPEAENWKPDPDSVPVTGDLPDPRLNKDPLTERQRMALKRERRFGLAVDGLSAGTCASSPMACSSRTSTSTNVSNWPAPALHSTGLPRALAPPTTHPIFTPPEALNVVETPLPAPVTARSSTPKATTPAKFADSSKGTMETLPAQPSFQRPHTPAASITSQRSESPDKTPVPAWARSLAHLLEESPPKHTPSSRSLPVRDQPATLPLISTPPHLRKQRPAAKTEPTKATPAPQPANVTSQERSVAQYRGGPMDHSAEDIKLQKTLLESFIPKKPASSSQGHQRYLHTKLISIMEDEMDMQRRTTRRELHDMSDNEFQTHFDRTSSMHKLTWDINQRRDKIDEMDLKTSLTNFQQQELLQFKQSNGST